MFCFLVATHHKSVRSVVLSLLTALEAGPLFSGCELYHITYHASGGAGPNSYTGFSEGLGALQCGL